MRTRTCIACGMQDDKVALHRIVRTSDGRVFFDGTGRAAGRGAYVCSLKCFEDAAKRGKFDRALKTKVSQEDCGRIGAELVAACASSEA